jgi:hypothetical protein
MPCAITRAQEVVVTDIEVSRMAEEQLLLRFHVRLADDDGSLTEHDVTLSNSDCEDLDDSYPTPETFIRSCFEFLLERESKESILASFDMNQISIYFPEFEREILRPG